MIKEAITATLLLSNVIINAGVYIDANKNVIYQGGTDYKVIRTNEEQNSIGYMKTITYEYNGYDDGAPTNYIRTTYTILDVYINKNIQHYSLNFERWTQIQEEGEYVFGNVVYNITIAKPTDQEATILNTRFLNVDNQTLINNFNQNNIDFLNSLCDVREIYTFSYTEHEGYRTDTYATGNQFLQEVPEHIYYVMKTSLNNTDHNYEFIDPVQTARGYSQITINLAWQTEVQDYEVIDIPGLMFTILGMPFTFLSTAFNLTLFPNTPYAINTAHILLTLVTALIIIWIIRKFTK